MNINPAVSGTQHTPSTKLNSVNTDANQQTTSTEVKQQDTVTLSDEAKAKSEADTQGGGWGNEPLKVEVQGGGWGNEPQQEQ